MKKLKLAPIAHNEWRYATLEEKLIWLHRGTHFGLLIWGPILHVQRDRWRLQCKRFPRGSRGKKGSCLKASQEELAKKSTKDAASTVDLQAMLKELINVELDSVWYPLSTVEKTNTPIMSPFTEDEIPLPYTKGPPYRQCGWRQFPLCDEKVRCKKCDQMLALPYHPQKSNPRLVQVADLVINSILIGIMTSIPGSIYDHLQPTIHCQWPFRYHTKGRWITSWLYHLIQ